MNLTEQKPVWTATAPSNIAFQKYWGRRDPKTQWPANDSFSMTLTEARTITSVSHHRDPWDVFKFQGTILRSDFDPTHKVFRHLAMLRRELNTDCFLTIESSNTFPSDCGIASSASGFAALTIAAAAALTQSSDFDALNLRGVSRDRLAHWARRGSGSAGRSLYGGFVHWEAGTSTELQKITPLFPETHWTLADLIVVLSDAKKSLPSSEAHLAAWESPLFSIRLAATSERLKDLKDAVATRHLEHLGRLIEAEALEMHSVAMTGVPSVCYVQPETATFTAWVRQQRSLGEFPAWFTIDAGPNPHLICDPQHAATITKRIKKEWPEAVVIADQVGCGPTLSFGDRK